MPPMLAAAAAGVRRGDREDANNRSGPSACDVTPFRRRRSRSPPSTTRAADAAPTAQAAPAAPGASASDRVSRHLVVESGRAIRRGRSGVGAGARASGANRATSRGRPSGSPRNPQAAAAAADARQQSSPAAQRVDALLNEMAWHAAEVAQVIAMLYYGECCITEKLLRATSSPSAGASSSSAPPPSPRPPRRRRRRPPPRPPPTPRRARRRRRRRRRRP